MKATVMYGAGDVRVENVPDASMHEPTDALVRVTRACICGSDLWPYKDLKPGTNFWPDLNANFFAPNQFLPCGVNFTAPEIMAQSEKNSQ